MNSSVKELKEMLADDPTKELLTFLKEDSERQAKRDDMFLQLMSTMITGNAIQQPTNQYNMPPQQNYHHRYGMSNMVLDNHNAANYNENTLAQTFTQQLND